MYAVLTEKLDSPAEKSVVSPTSASSFDVYSDVVCKAITALISGLRLRKPSGALLLTNKSCSLYL